MLLKVHYVTLRHLASFFLITHSGLSRTKTKQSKNTQQHLWQKEHLEQFIKSEGWTDILNELPADISTHPSSWNGLLVWWERWHKLNFCGVFFFFYYKYSSDCHLASISYWYLLSLFIFFQNTVADQLQNRYGKDQIYTYVGDTLIAVNPFHTMEIYTPEVRGDK